MNENHSPSVKLWIEYKHGAWKLISDLDSFRLCGGSNENGTMELAYGDVKKLLAHIAVELKSPTETAVVPVVTPLPATGRFE